MLHAADPFSPTRNWRWTAVSRRGRPKRVYIPFRRLENGGLETPICGTRKDLESLGIWFLTVIAGKVECYGHFQVVYSPPLIYRLAVLNNCSFYPSSVEYRHRP